MRAHRRAVPVALVSILLVASLGLQAGSAAPGVRRPAVAAGLAMDRAPDELDARRGAVTPTQAQREAAARLGATVRWNRFGTPWSLFRVRGALAEGLPADPVGAARTFLADNAQLFRLTAEDVARLELLGNNPIGRGSAVLLRQRFGSLPAGSDGLVALAVMDGRVLYVSSTLSGAASAPAPATIGAVEAWVRAARAMGFGVSADAVRDVRAERGWTAFEVPGLIGTQRVRPVAVPTYTQGVRAAFEAIVLDNEHATGVIAATSFVDGRSGEVLVRHDRVNFDGEPKWSVFDASPKLDHESEDTRVMWCWVPAEGCDRVLALAAPMAGSDGEWDRLQGRIPGVATLFPVTNTTIGNFADSAQGWLSPLTPSDRYRPVSTGRDYSFEWSNDWFESNCDPTTLTPGGNDIDAAIANLFAMHNRMHDWAYHLGFTERTWNLQYHNYGAAPSSREGDPEIGNAQAGALDLGPGLAVARDNANQITLNDGIPGVTNMYLWQPLQAAFYPPCVDGDYDASVIAHEYTHAISNRMVAGPDAGLDPTQSRAMGESWSDLAAVELLSSFGDVPIANENPFAVGPYVTGDLVRGIRNYPMNASPLNYSDIQYDFGSQVHADGEIWSAIQFDIRRAFIRRYGAGTPGVQIRCGNGDLPPHYCPGNRRWIQLIFDAWLLMQSNVDMVDARNAMLVADQMRFAGANQDLLWNGFARRGLGQGATSRSGADNDPNPSFTSPFATEARVTFRPVAASGRRAPRGAEIFVGRYEANAMPVADTIPDEPDQLYPKTPTASLVPGTYEFVARADGFGHVRFRRTLRPGERLTLNVRMPRNEASGHWGAAATGDGVDLANLIDDTEETSWARTGSPPVEGAQVTVDLAGDAPVSIAKVRVGAIPFGRPRFSALRSFRILVCTARGDVACDDAEQFRLLYTSPAAAFPGEPPRPRVPDLNLREFDVPDTTATHVRLVVLTNQCGNEDFQGDRENDPTNDSDCATSQTNAAQLPPQGGNVTVDELQVIGPAT